MLYLKLYEEYINDTIPNEFEKLKNIALRFSNATDFSKSLNFNELGYDKENSFLGERFLRLNRGYSLDEVEEFEHYDLNENVTIYRTGNAPIVWGDYVYINYEDAKHALDSGQGEEIYHIDTTYNDLIHCTQGSGEFFYSPKHLREYSKLGLENFWNKVNNIDEKIDDNVTKSGSSIKDKVIELINNANEWEDFEDSYYDLMKNNNENPFQFEIDELWNDIRRDI